MLKTATSPRKLAPGIVDTSSKFSSSCQYTLTRDAHGLSRKEHALTDSATAEDRIAFLCSLRAVRSFRPDPVPREVIDDILDVARWSGSASNRQPWELVLVRDRSTLDALASVEGHAAFLNAAGAAVVLVMSGDPERVAHETYDEGRLAERIMLAAHAHGVGSSIGWFVG